MAQMPLHCFWSNKKPKNPKVMAQMLLYSCSIIYIGSHDSLCLLITDNSANGEEGEEGEEGEDGKKEQVLRLLFEREGAERMRNLLLFKERNSWEELVFLKLEE